MTLPTFTMRQMIEAGVHFGHHARRWNPKMAPYIFGKKDNVHIIDLQKTYPMLYTAMATTKEIAAQGGKVLFVATKRQAQEIIKENAERCGQYFVNQRWLGGMLTNWKTVHKSINRLVKLNEMFEKGDFAGYTKKELQGMKKEQEKLQQAVYEFCTSFHNDHSIGGTGSRRYACSEVDIAPHLQQTEERIVRMWNTHTGRNVGTLQSRILPFCDTLPYVRH